MGRRSALFVACAVLVVLATRLLPGGASPQPDLPVGGASVIEAPPAPAIDAGVRRGLLPPDERVAFWEGRVSKRESAGVDPSSIDLIHLSDAYVDRARATGTADDLVRAATALDRAAAAGTADRANIEGRRALVALNLHEFGDAARRAKAILAERPDDALALGVSGDAHLEMGDLEAAAAHYRHLAELVPSPPAWSRLARLAFLQGDPERALRLVTEATGAAEAEGVPDALAFYRFQLGELERMAGRVEPAGSAYEAALTALPDYAPAMAGLARVREAQGRRGEAISLLEAATARAPAPELVAAMGDLYALDGDERAAERQYALVERIGQVGAAVGSVYDRALVLFAADHGREVAAAVELAEAELAIRPDVYGWDALAWALFRTGRLEEAAVAADHALALGTPDPRLRYHAGMIAAARGETDSASALLRQALAAAVALPPAQVSVARAQLDALEGRGR